MSDGHRLRAVVWNVEWAGPRSRRGRILRDRIWDLDPDVVCICEGMEAWMPAGGHVLATDRPYDPLARDGQRKVMLWSRHPWERVDRTGDGMMPPGRFLRATTTTPRGPRLAIATSGTLPGLEAPIVDHLAHTAELSPAAVSGLPRFEEHDTQLSDHSGVLVELARNRAELE